jgi:hypothetical protein
MKPALVLVAAVAILVAPVASTSSGLLAAPASSSAIAKSRESVLYGHIKRLTRKGRHFEMRFDPAWWLTGFTAQRAKLEDTGSSDVPNDYYIVDEGHRLLTYLVPPAAHVTVLTGGTDVTRAFRAQGRLLDSGRLEIPQPRPLARSAVPAVNAAPEALGGRGPAAGWTKRRLARGSYDSSTRGASSAREPLR